MPVFIVGAPEKSKNKDSWLYKVEKSTLFQRIRLCDVLEAPALSLGVLLSAIDIFLDFLLLWVAWIELE